MSSVTGFNTVDANCIPIGRIARLTTVKIVHWERRVRRYLVQALSVRHCFFHRILIIKYLVKNKVRQKQNLKHINRTLLPLTIGCTPLARHKPPNLLLKIWLNSKVAVALFVISTPAAKPSKIRLRLSIGCDWVDINTPACALRKMSFSSSMPWKND